MGRRFEAGAEGWGLQLRDVQVGDGLVLGTPVVPNLWGAEGVLGSFGGVRAGDRLVPNLLTSHPPHPKECTQTTRPISKRNAAHPPHMHPRTPINQYQTEISPPNKHGLNPYSASSPSTYCPFAPTSSTPPSARCWMRWSGVARNCTAWSGNVLAPSERESWVRVGM